MNETGRFAPKGRDLPADANPIPPTVPGLLTIDLDAVADNWRHLDRLSGRAETAGVVKGNGYGIGLEQAGAALSGAGCRTFFVATFDEAARLRAHLGAAPAVYMLDGFIPGSGHDLDRHDIRPVLGSLPEIEDWAAFCAATGAHGSAAIHLDSGMHRLGLEASEVDALAARPDLLTAFDPALVLSHFACADLPGHPRNRVQMDRFDAMRAKLPAMPTSLANSPATLTLPESHFDMVRPGVAAYGGRAVHDGSANPMRSAVSLDVHVLRVRTVAKGDPVGYGATHTPRRDSRIALLSVGYADGLLRAASSNDTREGASVTIGGHRAPIFGRLSMDLIAVDVTDLPPDMVGRGAVASFFGDDLTVDDYADRAGTIGYEVLTSLGRRFARRYLRDGRVVEELRPGARPMPA